MARAPLADFTYENFARTRSPSQELRLETLEDRIDAQLALGRGGEVIAELESLVAESPLRERLRGQLMLALYRAGRQADALQAYHDARAHARRRARASNRARPSTSSTARS